ncbi:MAG: DUF4358 domain-containing protein [Oscillospiraceae bacterium]|jgi:hypothetical protein|nr:DUF4358 domain-containing protein [Oscillospiraceae bacterium]
MEIQRFTGFAKAKVRGFIKLPAKSLIAPVLTFALALLTACTATPRELPTPQELFGAVEREVALPAMVEATDDEVLAYLGIDSPDYSACAYYTGENSLKPDEIAIFAAIDEPAAERIEAKLRSRLEYMAKSAENYLPDNLPIIERAVVRRDRLTVAMFVSADADAIAVAYADALAGSGGKEQE